MSAGTWREALPLNAFEHGQKTRQRRDVRYDQVGAAGQQQPFVAVAQAGAHLAYRDFQAVAAAAAQGVDLVRQVIDLVALVQRENQRRRESQHAVLRQFVVALQQLPVGGQRRRAFQDAALGQIQAFVAAQGGGEGWLFSSSPCQPPSAAYSVSS